MTRVVFVLFPEVHLLDLAGPAQAFSAAEELGHPYTLSYMSEQDQVRSAQGLMLSAHRHWPDLCEDDLVLIPGWRAPVLREVVVSPETLERLRAHHASGGTVASVCVGAQVLAQAGLLDGRRCTTHHQLQDEFAARHPRATVLRDVLFTSDDRVVTSAGIASGIDLALHLLATRHGSGLAARVARQMVVYARRNGHDPQDSAMLRHRNHLDDNVHRVQDVIDAHYVEPLPLTRLAAHVGVSPRTLTRQFAKATHGMTPLRYQQELRIERADHLIAHGATVESAAREVGFEDARMLRRLRSRPSSRQPDPSNPQTRRVGLPDAGACPCCTESRPFSHGPPPARPPVPMPHPTWYR